MTPTSRSEMPDKTRISLLGLTAVVVVGCGVAFFGRGPAPLEVPQMAGTPVTMSTGQTIYVQRFEVTIAEWNACAVDNGCSQHLRARPDQDAAVTPATGLSFVDAQQYVDWINKKTGHSFRLPTVAEWSEMAASVLPHEPDPIFTDPSLTWASAYLMEGIAPRALKPQGSFSTSPEGVADLDGSVWEWTQECYAGSKEGVDPTRCPAFFVGGEHVAAMSYLIRDPARGGCAVGSPPAHLGMRLVSDRPT
jgi:formylglycine-generating enzyme required for sulfatase activity